MGLADALARAGTSEGKPGDLQRTEQTVHGTMTGNLKAAGFLFTWVQAWGIGGCLIEAGLLPAGIHGLEGGPLGSAIRFTHCSRSNPPQT